MRMLLAGVLVLCLVFPWGATALAFSGIVAFGDSLSDNGPEDGYGLRISSNGRVWVDYLAERLGVDLLDMAYSSAQTDYHPVTKSAKWGFGWQIDEYLSTTGAAASDKLYVVWIGGNDLLKHKGDAGPIIDNAVTNIVLGIDRLVGAGAENMLVMNLPDLGSTPLMNGHNLHLNGKKGKPKFVANPEGGARLAMDFNQALKRALSPFRNTVNLIEVDVFALMNRFAAERVFDNTTHMLMANQPTGDSYMFWDTHHPTDDAHRLIAEAVYQLLAAASPPTATVPTGIGPFIPGGVPYGSAIETFTLSSILNSYTYTCNNRRLISG